MNDTPIGKAWTTRRIAIMALFTAISIALTFIRIPLIPAAPYLIYDPSGIFCIFAGLMEGPLVAAIIGVLTWLPRAFPNPLGVFMAVLSTVTMAVPIAYIYQRNSTRTGLWIGCLVGGVASVVACIVGNFIVTPIYLKISVEAVAAIILPAILPFNVIKVAINVAACQLCYKSVVHIARATRQ